MSVAEAFIICRFCAEQKPYDEIKNISEKKYQCLIEQLTDLGLSFVDFSNKLLPEKLCISCYEHSTVSCEFLLKVKKSQDVLILLLETKNENTCAFPLKAVKTESETDDGDHLQDDYLPRYEDTESIVKDEILENTDKKVYNESFQEFPPPDEIRTWADYPSICQHCQLKVSNNAVLIDHCVETHKTCFGSRCVDCHDNLNDFSSFVNHVRTHRPYLKDICPHCNKNILDEPNHSSKHSSLTCATCGLTFKLKRHLQSHQSTTKTKRKPQTKLLNSTCPICGMVMKTQASLKSHLQTHKKRKRNYTCEICGKAYYTKGCLDVHRKIHDNQTRESCQICHKTFLTVSRLKKHIITHNLQMPYQCDICKKFYNSKDRLRQHIRVHYNILPYQCSFCSKKFRYKSMMVTHQNQHTGAKPYTCNTCLKEFANWSNCNKHMKRKHGTTLAKNKMTPHGKIALNPVTGKPVQLYMTKKVKEWSEIMLGSRNKKLSQFESLS